MKTSCRAALLVAVALSGCGRVGYDGGGLDAGDQPLTDAEGKLDATGHTDARDSGSKTADGHADTGKAHDARADVRAGDAATDTGVGDAATDTGTGDAATDSTVGDAAVDARTSDAEAGVDSSLVCATAYVCGDGTDNTTLNTSYRCSGGMIAATGTPCAFGCDLTTGQCADLVPANEAVSHVASGDTFSCLTTQTSALASISGGASDSIVFNTSTPSVTKNNGAPITIPWGAPYTPTGGGTHVVVAHVAGLSLASGASVTITGSYALILLVDGDVSISGSTTVVDLSAHFSATATPSPLPGPGTSTAGTGGNTIPEDQNGGGGGGHGVAGGAGGAGGAVVVTGAAGGPAYGSTTPFVLVAGSSGGGTSPDHVGRGGGGLQISACGDISIGPGVHIDASGGGGEGGATGGSPGGGFGGGSGGTIILESATTNSLTGFLVANGGGGGQGATGTNVGGTNGYDTSSVYDSPAPGGGALGAAGSGGAGGAGSTPPANGMAGAPGGGGGGGGGAYGAIFIGVSPNITAPPHDATGASPGPWYSHTCTTAGGATPTTCSYPQL